MLKVKDKEKNLKRNYREKTCYFQVARISLTSDFSTETMKARR